MANEKVGTQGAPELHPSSHPTCHMEPRHSWSWIRPPRASCCWASSCRTGWSDIHHWGSWSAACHWAHWHSSERSSKSHRATNLGTVTASCDPWSRAASQNVHLRQLPPVTSVEGAASWQHCEHHPSGQIWHCDIHVFELSPVAFWASFDELARSHSSEDLEQLESLELLEEGVPSELRQNPQELIQACWHLPEQAWSHELTEPDWLAVSSWSLPRTPRWCAIACWRARAAGTAGGKFDMSWTNRWSPRPFDHRSFLDQKKNWRSPWTCSQNGVRIKGDDQTLTWTSYTPHPNQPYRLMGTTNDKSKQSISYAETSSKVTAKHLWSWQTVVGQSHDITKRTQVSACSHCRHHGPKRAPDCWLS